MRSLNNNYADVNYNSHLQAVELKWKDITTSDECKRAFIIAYDIVVTTKCTCWISDMTQGKSFSTGIAKWFRNEFAPKLADQGITKIAFHINSDSFDKFYTDSLKSAFAVMGISLCFFQSRCDLERWILLPDTVAECAD
jgi:hypothetical protein